MPVQTRRRAPAKSAAAAEPVEVPAKKAAAAAKPKAEATKPAAKSVPAKRSGSKTPKREPSPKRAATAKQEPKQAFNGVLSQIQDLGPTRIKKNLVSRKQRSRSKQHGKQATDRLVKRQLLSQELHRLSNPDLLSTGKTQQPKEIKARAQAEEKRRVAGETIKRRALFQEIREKGDKGLHAILHRPRAIHTAGKSTAVARRISSSSSGAPNADPKQLKGKTLVELSELVSPRTAFHPSIVKQKLQTKDTHRQVGLEMMKYAQVQEIKRRGDKSAHK